MKMEKHSKKRSEGKETKKFHEKIAVKPVHLDGTNFMINLEKSERNKNQFSERINKFEDNILDDLYTEKNLYEIETFDFEPNSHISSTRKRKSLQKSFDRNQRQVESNFDLEKVMKSVTAFSKANESKIISKEMEVGKHYNNILCDLLNPDTSTSANKKSVIFSSDPLSAVKAQFIPYKYNTGSNFNKPSKGYKKSEGVESITKMTKDEESTTAINSTSCEINRTLRSNVNKRTKNQNATRNTGKKQNLIALDKDFPFQRFEIAERKRYGYDNPPKQADQKDNIVNTQNGVTFQQQNNQERLMVNKRIMMKSNDTTIHKNNKYERPATTNALLPVKQRHPLMEKRRLKKEK